MQTIYVTEAEHFSTPGRPIKAHASKALAIAEAIELTNIMLKDDGRPANATSETWEDGIETLQNEHGAAHCYVAIYELPVHGSEAAVMSGHSTAAHTDGPWRRDGLYVTNAVGATIADCGKSPTLTFAEKAANAELFVAALDTAKQRDELLAALKPLVDEAFKNMTGGKGHLIDNAYAAIAKAEGGA